MHGAYIVLLLLLMVVVAVNSSYSGINISSCDLSPDSYKCPFRTLLHTLQEIPYTCELVIKSLF